MRRALPTLILGTLIACNGGPCRSDAPIVDVDFVGPGPEAALTLDEALAENRVTADAQHLDGFSVRRATGSEVGWQLIVRTRLATERIDDDDPSRVRRGLGAAAELRRLVPPEGDEVGRFQAEVLEVRTVDRGAAIEPHLLATIDALIGRLDTSIRLSKASPEQLAQAIGSEDDHARAVATSIVRTKKLDAVRPALERRLQADDCPPQEILRIAGALSEFGHPDSASAIIDAISRYPEHAIPLLFVLGRVGGREAAAYLFTVESGHQDPGVRAAAGDALRELENRQAASSDP